MKKSIVLIIIALLFICLCISSCVEEECVHEFSEMAVGKEATCIEAGSRHLICSKCSLIKEEAIEKSEHDMQVSDILSPTCTESGYTEYVCSVCGIKEKGSILAATNHNYQMSGNFAPTCTEKGYTLMLCSNCGDSKQSNFINESAHSYAIVSSVAATCSSEGKNSYKCSVCGDLRDEAVAKLDHLAVTEPARAATCTETGLTEGKHCSVCNFVITKQNVVSAKGHTAVTDKAVAATCTQTGLTEGKHCSVCNVVITKQNVVGAKGHTAVTDKAVAATCTKTGLTEGKHCSVCKAVITKQNVVSATGHTEVIDNAVAATCTQTGLSEGKHCSVCNTVLVSQQVIAVSDHNYSNLDWSCSNCGTTNCVEYNSYEAFYSVCSVTDDGSRVRFLYDNPKPIILNLQKFVFPSGKQYVFVFGSNAGRCMVSSNGTVYANVTFEIQKRLDEYELMFRNASFENVNSIIRSDAYLLNLTLAGEGQIIVQTTKAASGGNGKSYGAFQIGNGEAGGRGADANPAILCNGMLKITCGAPILLRGGSGGNGGKGGDSDSSGSSGGRGGDGGNGAVAIWANDVEVSFINGIQRSDFSISGGTGGSQGSGGTGKGFLWIGSSKAADGTPGSSALACNVEIRYN